ncbi:hypothetical protein ACJJTC_002808 [Scirpophaga incertulas]
MNECGVCTCSLSFTARELTRPFDSGAKNRQATEGERDEDERADETRATCTHSRSACLGVSRRSTIYPEIRIYEVGPRDGLQNESKFVPTDVKIELINKLAGSGITNIESASFVSPKWVKQMSDGPEIMKNLHRKPGVNYPVLVPNLKGYNIAKECSVEEVAIFPAGSESFSQKNLNCSIEEGLKRFKEVADQAVKDRLRVRGYISCVVGCPYDGPISPKSIAKITEELLAMGCYEVSLGDTIGVGTAGSVRKLLREVLTVAPPRKLALHFHDTYGQALSNLLAGLEFGVSTVDSSISGLGGCPLCTGSKAIGDRFKSNNKILSQMALCDI